MQSLDAGGSGAIVLVFRFEQPCHDVSGLRVLVQCLVKVRQTTFPLILKLEEHPPSPSHQRQKHSMPGSLG